MLRINESQSLLSRTNSHSVIGRVYRLSLAAAIVLGFLAVGARSFAAPIVYGNFVGNTVDYLNVQEDTNSGDTLPLFGAPTVSGDSLDFDPVGFDANATGAAGNDITDGNLNFIVMSHAGFAIHDIHLAEAGDTTLAGFGNDQTFTSVTGTGVLNITAVDGAGIAPIAVPISLTFTPSGGTYGLLTDGGGGPLYHSGWSGSWTNNIEQILVNNNIPFTSGATKISINLDNTLTALSQAGTSALIAKKDFGGLSVTVNHIPEPTSWVLLAICGLITGGFRRGR